MRWRCGYSDVGAMAGAPTIPLLMGMGAIDGFAKGALTGMLTCFIEEFFFKGDV